MTKIKHITAALAAVLFCSAPDAQAWTQINSAAFYFPAVGCTGTDEYETLSASLVGAGTYPTAPVTIVGYDLSMTGAIPSDYAMMGHTGSPDVWTGYAVGVAGGQHVYSDPYAAGNGFTFDPAATVLHLHFSCQSSEGQMGVRATVFYVSGT